MQNRLKFFLAVLLAVTGLVFLSACGKKEQSVQAATPGSGRPAPPVIVSTVQQRDVPIQINAIGNVQAYQTVQIRSQVNGQIERVYFKEGQDVKKGQLLFTLDKAPFQAALEQAIGTLKKDQAQAALAKVDAERYTNLEKQGIVPVNQADQMRAQEQSNSAAVVADQAAVDAAKVQLGYTEIRSPLNARTGQLLINQGNLVKANDTPYLVQLNQITPIYVTFSIPENQLAAVREFAARNLTVLAYPKGQTTNPSRGKLTFIDNTVDPQTGMVQLKATFQNSDKSLWPGEYVDVVLNLSTEKNAILVPTKAVQSGQQGDFVFVVAQDNSAKAQPVTTKGTYKNETIIASGLSAGETVVVDGQLRIVPNGKVTIQSKLPPADVGASTDSVGAIAGGGQ